MRQNKFLSAYDVFNSDREHSKCKRKRRPQAFLFGHHDLSGDEDRKPF